MMADAIGSTRDGPTGTSQSRGTDEELVHDLEVDDVVDVEIKHRYYSRYSVSRVASLYV